MSNTPRFYLNPITGRLIKSTASTFKDLKKRRFRIDKDSCFYNTASAKKCMERLLRLYPNLFYPSSNLIDIPKTFKHGKARAFIKNNKNKIIGYIDKKGKKHRLFKPIYSKKKLPIVYDSFNVLPMILEKQKPISSDNQHIIEKQILKSEPLTESVNILFNPLQNDFIPTKSNISEDEKKYIINTINQEIIPSQLPPISISLNISGIIKDQDYLIGIVDTNNQIKRFSQPIKIINISKKQSDRLEVIPESISDYTSKIEVSEIPESVSEYKETEIPSEQISETVTYQEPLITEPEDFISETVTYQEPVTQTEDLVSETVSEASEEPVTQPEDLVSETISETISEPVSEVSEEPVTQTVIQPEDLVSETISETISEAVSEVSEEPVTQTVTQPEDLASETISEPVSEVSEEPVTQTVTQPEDLASETISEPVSEVSEQPVTEISETVTQPEDLASETISEVSEQLEDLASETISEVSEEPVTQTVTQPEDLVSETISEVSEEPVTQTVTQPEDLVSEAVTEPILTKPEMVTEPEESVTEAVTETEPILTEPEMVTEPILTEPEMVTEPILTEPEQAITTNEQDVTVRPELTDTVTQTSLPEKVSIDTQTILPEIIEELPSLQIMSPEDKIDLENYIKTSPILSDKETQTITEQIKCLDGEQYDLNEKRCLPCTYYELIWDSEYKQCKPILKTEFLKQKKEQEMISDIVLDGLQIISDDKQNIIGYIEK
jgi:hypothetical protein